MNYAVYSVVSFYIIFRLPIHSSIELTFTLGRQLVVFGSYTSVALSQKYQQ